MRHSVLEAWLERGGVKFDYQAAVLLDSVVIEKAAEENIRLGAPLNQEIVMKYGIDLENGADFPAIVLYKIARGKNQGHLGLINGRHRLEAFRLAGKKQIDAYVIRTDDELVIETLQRTANMIEGLPLAEEERLEHALRLVQLDYSMIDAARLMSVKIGQVRDRKAYQEAMGKLRQAGVQVGNLGLSQHAVVKLRAIPRDKHFVRAVQLAHEARLGSDEMRELITAVRQASDDGAVDVVLDEWDKKTETQRARSRSGLTRGPSSPVRSLSSVLQRAERIMKGPGNLKTLTVKELDGIILQASRLCRQLQAFVLQLRRARRAVK